MSLIEVAKYLPKELKTEALALACSIDEEETRAIALKGIIPYLTEEFSSEILDAVRTIGDDHDRAVALVSTVNYLPDDLKNEVMQAALATGRAIVDKSARVSALLEIAICLPYKLKVEVVNEAFSTLRDISSEYALANTLSRLSPILIDEWKAEALGAAKSITLEDARAQALSALVFNLPNDLKAEALTAALAITSERYRASALSEFVPYLPDELKTIALAALQAITDVNIRAKAIRSVTSSSINNPRFDREAIADIREVWAAARYIKDNVEQATMLATLVPFLPKPLKEECTKLIQETVTLTTDNAKRVPALLALARALPEDRKREVFSTSFVINELEEIEPGWIPTLMLVLPEDVKTEVAEVAWKCVCSLGSYYQAQALPDFASSLPEHLRIAIARELWLTVININDENVRAEALSYVAPELPDHLRGEAVRTTFSSICVLDNEESKAYALSSIARALPKELQESAVDVARRISDQEWRAYALAGLVASLPADLAIEALREALLLTKASVIPGIRQGIYSRIISTWKELGFRDFPNWTIWIDILRALASNPRNEILNDLSELTPLIDHLGGQSVIEDFYYALRDVTHWWP